MCWMRVLSLCICISYIMGNAKDNENKVFAFAGCNATLEWILWNGAETVRANVWNASGIKIAWVDDINCTTLNDSSVYCYTRKLGEKWMLYVILINATEANRGGYTGEIKYGLVDGKNIFKELIIRDKPQIRKEDKTILGKPLNISCAVAGKLDGVNYRWKLNGTDLNYTGRINVNLSELIFKSLWTVDKSSIFSCEVCQENSCCVTSDTFSLDPYYGPFNVDLDVKETHIYLNENEHFTVKCSANCNPVCSFWWEGYINSNDEELVIMDFDSRKAGQYICNARNKETDITTKSDPIFLHLAEASSPELNEGLRQEILWKGPVIVSVFLLVIGCLIIACRWRKNKCRKTAVQQNRERRIERSECSCIPREPSSLQDLSDLAKRSRNQSIKSMTLQTLSLPSNPMERKHMHRDSWPYDTRLFSGRNRPDKSLAKPKRNDNVFNDDYDDGVNCQAINNSRQEDLRSTIDKDALWIYDQVGEISINESSNKFEWSTEHRFDHYARSIEINDIETADLHITDGAYITPISDLACPIQACQIEKVYERASQQPDVDATDGSYITPFIDFSEPFEICQVEETDLNETDQTYITPVLE